LSETEPCYVGSVALESSGSIVLGGSETNAGSVGSDVAAVAVGMKVGILVGSEERLLEGNLVGAFE